VLKGLEVNVRGLVADGLGEHQVDETDDGSLPRQLLDIRLAQCLPISIVRRCLQVIECGIDRNLLLTVVLPDKQLHFLGVCHTYAHLTLQGEG
jgi:hypothetical protein